MPQYTQIQVSEENRFSQQGEIQEMLGNPPGWILYSGISIVLLVAVVGLLMASFIKYPDKMEAPVIIRTEQAPTVVVSPMSEVLDSLLVSDGQKVAVGELLVILKNAACFEDVLTMEKSIHQLMAAENSLLYKKYHLDKNLRLGDLQNGYAILNQQVKDLQFFTKNPSIAEQGYAIKKEIQQIKYLNASLLAQADILVKEVNLVKKDYERNQDLFQAGALSELELEKKESTYLAQQRVLKQMQTTQIQNTIRIEQLNAQKIKLQRDKQNNESVKILTLQQQCESIKGEIQRWKQQYLTFAPIAGELVFQTNLEEKMPLKAGMPLFTILPNENKHLIFAYCEMPVIGAGKIVKGNTAHIYLDEWPYKVYGMIEAKVDKIASIAQKTEAGYHYNVRLILPQVQSHGNKDSISTTYQKTIPFHQNMTGTTNIITEDKSILERIFEQFLDLLKN